MDKFSFSMAYYYNENFMLSISHDEVVHGKNPMLYKMHGDEWQKFANLRLLYTYMFTHPGGSSYTCSITHLLLFTKLIFWRPS